MLSSKSPGLSSRRTSPGAELDHRSRRPLARLPSALVVRAASALAALSLVAASGCCRLGADEAADAGPKASADAAASPAPASSSALAAPMPLQPTSEQAVPIEPQREIAGAAHILIAYKGAQLATKEVLRSKEEAKRRAEEVLTKLNADKSAFADLAKQYSDDPSKIAGGAIGNFERNAMPPSFADATFALEVGAISGVVESPRGFHIIKRTR